MLRQRLIVALLMLVPGILCIYLGGFWYFAVLLLFFIPAAYEYTQMMQKTGCRPAGPLIVGGAALLASVQSAPALWPALESRAGLLSGSALVFLLVAATTWHLIDFERGAPASGTDWAITVAGIVYLGWTSG